MKRAFPIPGLVAAATVWLVLATILYGSPWQPLALIVLWPERLGAPYWPAIGFAATVLAGVVFLLPARLAFWKPALFVAAALVGATVSIGVYADQLRAEAFTRAEADKAMQHSFFRSLREAPREHQFYLHGAIMRNCVPFGWSYREMGFYRLPDGIARNVLPPDWRKECDVPTPLRFQRPGEPGLTGHINHLSVCIAPVASLAWQHFCPRSPSRFDACLCVRRAKLRTTDFGAHCCQAN